MKLLFVFLLTWLLQSVNAQCLKADIIFILDWSGTESRNTHYITDAAQAFVDESQLGPSSVKIGIIPFDDDPLVQLCLQPTANKETLSGSLAMLRSLDAAGGTSYFNALILAGYFFEQSRIERKETATKIIIFISDGAENFEREESIALANQLKFEGVYIWCIATPNSFNLDMRFVENDRNHMKAISSGPENGYYFEENHEILKEELLRLNLCP